MCVNIAKKLLESSGKTPEGDIITLPLALLTILLFTAAIVQDKIGAINAWGYDPQLHARDLFLL